MRNKVAYAISSSGDVYSWGSLTSDLEDGLQILSNINFLNSIPRTISNLKGKRIINLSCNSKIALCIGSDGIVYSFGDDTKGRYGVLGRGDIYYQYAPVIIQSLGKQKIVQVSIGISHASAIDLSGKIFLWGAGGGVQKRSNVPVSMKSEKGLSGKKVLNTRNGTVIVTSIYMLYNR